jgi:hypothetical protein
MKKMSIDDTSHTSEEATPLSPPRAERSKAAVRMRAYRQRRRDGMRCVTLDLRDSEIDRLIELGHLRRDDRADQNRLLLALYRS